MNLRHIEVIHAVFSTGTVSGGAKALNVSQPTVSNTLKHAEDLLGFKIFDRIKGRLYPTVQGKALFNEIQPVFKSLTDLEQAVQTISNVSADAFRIAMIPAIGLNIGPEAISNFCQTNKKIRIEAETLHSSDIINALHNDDIDMGLLFDAPKSPGIVTQKISETDFVVISQKQDKLSQNSTLKLSDLPKERLIMLNPKSLPGRYLHRKLTDELGDNVFPRIVVETYHLAKSLVSHGAGIAIVDRLTAQADGSEDIVITQLEPKLFVQIDVAYRQSNSLIKHQNEFIDVLSKLFSA